MLLVCLSGTVLVITLSYYRGLWLVTHAKQDGRQIGLVQVWMAALVAHMLTNTSTA